MIYSKDKNPLSLEQIILAQVDEPSQKSYIYRLSVYKEI